jgi:hypothetical protein
MTHAGRILTFLSVLLAPLAARADDFRAGAASIVI